MTRMEIALVTGATGAIGEAIARGLAQRGLRVVLAARSPKSARAVAERIGGDVSVEDVELGSAASISALRQRWRGPLDVLVNDAAIAPRKKELTEEGLERQFAVNVLGYTRMLARFADVLAESPRARVVNVASYWAGDLRLDDLMFERRPYDNDTAYRQSKQANRMLTAAWAERLPNIAINACHPGDVRSTLSLSLGFGGHETPEQGAATPLWLALEAPRVTGKYFARCREESCRFARDRTAVEALYEICQRFD